MLAQASQSRWFTEDVISRNITVQSIVSSPKPSFLLWDKVYQKLTTVEEETWLLRASESAAIFFNVQLTKNELARCAPLRFIVWTADDIHLSRRVQLGSTLLHLAVEGRTPEFRKRVLASLELLAILLPKVVNAIVRDALSAYLQRPTPSPAKASNDTVEDSKPLVNKQSRLLAYLSASASFADEVETAVREELLSDLVIIAHHPKICEFLLALRIENKKVNCFALVTGGSSRQAWIELCQKARTNPRTLVDNQLDNLLKKILPDDNKVIDYPTLRDSFLCAFLARRIPALMTSMRRVIAPLPRLLSCPRRTFYLVFWSNSAPILTRT